MEGGLSPLGEEEREPSAHKERMGDRGCWLWESKSGSSFPRKHWEEEPRCPWGHRGEPVSIVLKTPKLCSRRKQRIGFRPWGLLNVGAASGGGLGCRQLRVGGCCTISFLGFQRTGRTGSWSSWECSRGSAPACLNGPGGRRPRAGLCESVCAPRRVASPG